MKMKMQKKIESFEEKTLFGSEWEIL